MEVASYRAGHMIMGTGGLGAITSSPKEHLQIESFPGARFQHSTDMLKKDKANKKVPKFIIFTLVYMIKARTL